jgi:hypothetical protein
MAKLRVLDKVALGELIIKAAQNVGDSRERLLKDPVEALRKFIAIPADREEEGKVIKHTILVHEDSRDVTHVVLPWKDDVDRATDNIDLQPMIYPNEYRPGSPEFIDDTKKENKRKAIFFRFGDYMFGRCR